MLYRVTHEYALYRVYEVEAISKLDALAKVRDTGADKFFIEQTDPEYLSESAVCLYA